MGGAVSAIGSLISAPLNAVSNLVGAGNIIPNGATQALPTPPPPPSPLATPNAVPGADTIKARQDRIKQQEALRGTSATGTSANILTGAQGDTSLSDVNKKTLLGQ